MDGKCCSCSLSGRCLDGIAGMTVGETERGAGRDDETAGIVVVVVAAAAVADERKRRSSCLELGCNPDFDLLFSLNGPAY